MYYSKKQEVENWPYDRDGYYRSDLEIELKYRKLKKIVRKIKMYGKGKGPALTKEEQIWFKNNLISADEMDGTYYYSRIVKDIDKGMLNDREYCYGLYDTRNVIKKIKDAIIDRNNYNSLISYTARSLPYALYGYCIDLTSKEFKFNPAICRRKEIEELMFYALQSNKSVILVGKSGIGKKAIVEGAAYTIQKGFVHNLYKHYSILQTSLSMLDIDNKALDIKIAELLELLSKESRIALYIDDLHYLANLDDLTKNNISKTIKDYITNNKVCVVSTMTQKEYLDIDPALRKCFLVIDIDEPNDYILKQILLYTLDNYSNMYNISIIDEQKESILELLLSKTKTSNDNDLGCYYNPELSIKIISKAFSQAIDNNKKNITFDDIVESYNSYTLIYKHLNKYKVTE